MYFCESFLITMAIFQELPLPQAAIPVSRAVLEPNAHHGGPGRGAGPVHDIGSVSTLDFPCKFSWSPVVIEGRRFGSNEPWQQSLRTLGDSRLKQKPRSTYEDLGEKTSKTCKITEKIPNSRFLNQDFSAKK